MLKLIFTGNLTANPESRFVDTASGQHTVCNFTVAVNRIIRGEKYTEYIRVSCWDRQAENAMRYLAKGSKVCVASSTITTHAYTNRDGKSAASLEVSADDIEYLSSRSGAGDEKMREQAKNNGPDEGFMKMPEDIEDRLPFA